MYILHGFSHKHAHTHNVLTQDWNEHTNTHTHTHIQITPHLLCTHLREKSMKPDIQVSIIAQALDFPMIYIKFKPTTEPPARPTAQPSVSAVVDDDDMKCTSRKIISL